MPRQSKAKSSGGATARSGGGRAIAAKKAAAGQPSESQRRTAGPILLRLAAPAPLLLLALLILAAIFHGRMLFSGPNMMIGSGDIIYYFHWLHEYMRQEALAGRLPLWNPYNYCGTPFAGNPQATVFYPLNWLAIVVGAVTSHKLLIALHTWLAGAFMYGFLRQVRLARFAALAGCLPFMFGNYMMANASVGHLTMLFTLAWLPLALWMYERALLTGQRRWLLWTGAVLGVQFLAGEPQNCYYTALLIGGYGVVRSLWPGDEPDRARTGLRRLPAWALGMLIVGAVAACVSAVQLLPTAEFGAHSDRTGNDFRFATHVSLPPTSLFEFLAPYARPTYTGLAVGEGDVLIQQNWEFAGYVGLMTLALACVSLGVRRRSPLRAAQLLLLVALVMMLGRFTPIYKVMYAVVPGLSMFRIPARAVVIAHWALAVMAAFGTQHLFAEPQEQWRRWRWRIITIGTIALLVAATFAARQWLGLHTYVERAGKPELGPALTWNDGILLRPLILLLTTGAVILMLRWLPRQAALSAALALIAVDLFISKPRTPLFPYSIVDDANLKSYETIRTAMDERESPYRADLAPSWAQANAAGPARVEQVNGYAPLSIGRFYRLVHALRGREPSAFTRHELPESAYRIGEPFPLRIMNVMFATKWDAAKRRHELVRDPDPLPRAWVVHQAEVVMDEKAALERMKDRTFDVRTSVLLEQPPRIVLDEQFSSTTTPADRVVTKRISPHELFIETETANDGYLVLSEIFFPGWKAQMDGETVELERANSALTALPLPAGRHEIRYVYQPMSFALGASITGLSVVLLAAASVMLRKKGRESLP